MYPIKRILVGLDLSDMDDDLIHWAGFIAKYSEVERIYFVHVVRDLEIPDDILEEFPDLKEPADEKILEQMQARVKKHLDPSDYGGKINFDVKEGSAVRNFMKFVKVKHIDVIVLGKKIKSVGGGLMVGKLGRGATCGLMIVPEGSTAEIRRILVPIDESQHTEYALKRAVLLAKNLEPNPELICQNIYKIPEGYHKTGKTYMQFARIMKKHAHDFFIKLTHKLDMTGLNVQEKYTLDSDRHPVADILKVAAQQKVNLILIGAKAITPARAFFKRNVAEKLVTENTHFPIFIVRPRKKEGLVQGIKNL